MRDVRGKIIMTRFFSGLLLLLSLILSVRTDAQVRDTSNNFTVLSEMSDGQRAAVKFYIGEIKGRSYIKLSLRPVRDDDKLPEPRLKNKPQFYGSCYEAASNKFYELVGTYNSDTRAWEIKGYNIRRQYVCLFSGRQDADGNIDGTWKNKRSVHSFYVYGKSDE